jgi:hypothetical protein
MASASGRPSQFFVVKTLTETVVSGSLQVLSGPIALELSLNSLY